MELWKDIPGYEHLYQASNTGKIRTCEGKTTRSARFERRVWKQRELKQKWASRKGRAVKDARVTLWKDGKVKTHLVARLVAMAWCDGFGKGMTVNHIDCNPSNNNADNLEWVTLADNIRKGLENGQYKAKRVVLIDRRGRTLEFRSMAEAGRFLNRSNQYISGLLKRGGKMAGEYAVRLAQ